MHVLTPRGGVQFQVIMSQDEDIPQLVETQLQARLRESGALQVPSLGRLKPQTYKVSRKRPAS